MLERISLHEKREITQEFTRALKSFIVTDNNEKLHASVCIVCDSLAKPDLDWAQWVDIGIFDRMCDACNLEKNKVNVYYDIQEIVSDYTVDHPLLDKYVLSYRSYIDMKKNQVLVCNECYGHMEKKEKKNKQRNHPPPFSIANCNLIGKTPKVLESLNEVELSLLSLNRSIARTWVFYGGCHKSVTGWHTLFKNNVGHNVGTIQNLSVGGMRGNMLVVLCGPFTKTQKALTYEKVQVKPAKVLQAYRWLRRYNHFYRDVTVPHIDDIPVPRILHHDFSIEEEGNARIENQCTITLLLPDSSVQPTNGGFANQDQFRNFLATHLDNNFVPTLNVRPTNQMQPEYILSNIVKAFPLQFPYGHSGLPSCDPAVEKMKSVKRKEMAANRDKIVVLRRLLRHQRREFHMAEFNLYVNNVIMKDTAFQTARMMANVTPGHGKRMAEEISKLTSSEILQAIEDVERNNPRQYSSRPGAGYLRSLSAVCQALPHTNEASLQARRTFYSYCIRFGLPMLFVTITPDDSRSLLVTVYSLEREEYKFGKTTVKDFTSDQIINKYRVRQNIRTQYPGLCAYDYDRIMCLVIKYLFRWDAKECKSAGKGLFGDLAAFLQATEEQMRKTLHGHFLLFVKDYDKALNAIHSSKEVESIEGFTRKDAMKAVLDFYEDVASCNLFGDLNDMDNPKTYQHDGCRIHTEFNAEPAAKKKRYMPCVVDNEAILKMRHKTYCNELDGVVLKCPKCSHGFGINEIIQIALNTHLGDRNTKFDFPDWSRKLDYYVYEGLKDFDWISNNTPWQNALRNFTTNALLNIHAHTHTSRCFKHGDMCYANLPTIPTDRSHILQSENPQIWSDLYGNKEHKYMFKVVLKREVADMFMNTHNKELTNLLGCNTNVLCAMNGRSVFYVTGYCSKANQKEERRAYETVSKALIKAMNDSNQTEQVTERTPYQQGMIRLLHGVYTHTNSHVVAAPMANYLSIHGSRFDYSHTNTHFPVHGLEAMLDKTAMRMTLKSVSSSGGKVSYHRAFDYVYRPNTPLFDSMSPYEYYAKTRTMSKSQAEKDPNIQYFEYLDEHPLAQRDVVVYDTPEKVSVLPWSYIPSTSNFASSMHTLTQKEDDLSQFQLKETYAKRFLLVFSAYRNNILSLKDKPTYQESFMSRIRNDDISKDMLRFAENIQVLHNSLASEVIDDELQLSTQIDDDDIERDNEDEPEEYSLERIQDLIGSYLASSSESTDSLQQEATSFNLKETTKGTNKFRLSDTSIQNSTFGDAFETVASSSDQSHIQETEAPASKRFKAEYGLLNELLLNSGVQSRERMQRHNINRSEIIENGSYESIVAFGKHEGLDQEQEIAFQIMTAAYVLTFQEEAPEIGNNNQNRNLIRNIKGLKTLIRDKKQQNTPVRLFVTGPAGAGKSRILDAVIKYCSNFSNRICHSFIHGKTICLTALTGAAATEIGGDTTSRVFCLNSKSVNVEKKIQEFRDTRLIVVDEVSFADYHKDLCKLSERLKAFTECRDFVYGNIAIAFLGDFLQLEPVGNNSALKWENGLYFEQALTSVVELKGTHRFNNCEVLRDIMPRLREEGLSDDIRQILNERVMDIRSIHTDNINNVRFACYSNKKRSELSQSVFFSYLESNHSQDPTIEIPKSAIVVKCDASWEQNGKALSFAQRKVLYEECRDCDLKSKASNKSCDPFLCCISDCPLMGTTNSDVAKGDANGTPFLFQKAVLKSGREPHKIQIQGYWCYAVNIEDVDHLLLRWSEDCRFQGTYKMYTKKETFQVQFPIKLENGEKKKYRGSMKIKHFPVLLNHATTGHKLQGKSLNSLVIGQWSKVKNWVYVVLSRVREIKGLFFLSKIPDDLDFRPDDEYKGLMDRLRSSLLATKDDINDLEL